MSNEVSNRHPQRLAAAGVLLLSVFLLSACEGSQAVDPVQAQAAPSAQAKEPAMGNQPSSDATGGPSVDLDAVLKKDMAYADLRKLLINGGWEPVKDPQCQVQVAGYDQKTCSDNQDLALCSACERMPELSAYSGDGFATSQFRDVRTGKTLKVISYGMIEDWGVSGEDSRLRVEEWEGDARTETQK